MKTFITDELQCYVSDGVTRFDVPGHKGSEQLFKNIYKKKNILQYDINSMPRMDNLNHFKGIIKKSQDEIAKIHGAMESRILVNGTTEGIQTMIFSTVKENEEILIPINAHKSVLSSLIFSGAVPIYARVEYDEKLGIYKNLELAEIKKCLKTYPNIKTVFLINPSYYGFVKNLKEIIKYCKKKGKIVIVDEAHGGLNYFFPTTVKTAIELGADISCISYHKSLGSLTQSSLMLINNSKLIQAIDFSLKSFTTTSPSYFLMSSVELSVQYANSLKNNDKENLFQVSDYIKENIRKMSHFNLVENVDFSKILIDVGHTPYTGFDLYNLLLKKYNIQPELYENNVLLIILGIGDDMTHAKKLVDSLYNIDNRLGLKKYNNNCLKKFRLQRDASRVAKYSPREIHYKAKESIKIEKSIGRIIAESIMIYPPGIPILKMGQKITENHIDYLITIKNEGVPIQGITGNMIEVLKEDDL